MDGNLPLIKWMVTNGIYQISAYEYAMEMAFIDGHSKVVIYLASTVANIHTLNITLLMPDISDANLLELCRYFVYRGVDIHAANDYLLSCAIKDGQLNSIAYLVSRGAQTPQLTEFHRKYAAIWAKGQARLLLRIQKRIYFWWIRKCHEMSSPSGIRMAYRSLDNHEAICKS
jgi:hypothetical protein